MDASEGGVVAESTRQWCMFWYTWSHTWKQQPHTHTPASKSLAQSTEACLCACIMFQCSCSPLGAVPLAAVGAGCRMWGQKCELPKWI